jgi:hypothetical protein
LSTRPAFSREGFLEVGDEKKYDYETKGHATEGGEDIGCPPIEVKFDFQVRNQPITIS